MISTTCGTAEVAELVNAGIIQPMDASIDAVGRYLFSETVLNELSYNGQTYDLPYYSHAQVMWYRQNLLDNAGLEIPTTWDELYDAAVALTDAANGQYDCAVSLNTSDFIGTRYLNFYVRSGGSLLNDDLTANLTSDLTIEGIILPQVSTSNMLAVLSGFPYFFNKGSSVKQIRKDAENAVLSWV